MVLPVILSVRLNCIFTSPSTGIRLVSVSSMKNPLSAGLPSVTRMRCTLNILLLYYVSHDQLCSLKTKEMIEHLHNEHFYDLIDCQREHEHGDTCDESTCIETRAHSRECFILGDDFQFITNAQVLFAHLQEPIPLVNLVEHRRPETQKSAAVRIRARKPVKKSYQKSRRIIESDDDNEDEDAAPAIPTAGPSSAQEPIDPLEISGQELRACLAKFDPENKFGTVEIVQKLISEEMTIPLIIEYSVKDLKECGLTWPIGCIERLKEFMKNWNSSSS